MHGAGPPGKLAAVDGPPVALAEGTPATLVAALRGRVAEKPDGIIRSYSLDGAGNAQTYAEAWERSGGIGAGLRDFGVRAGDTVVLLIEDVVDFVPAYWACFRGGFVCVALMSAAREATHPARGGPLRAALDRLANVTILADESFAAIAATLRRERGLRVLPLGIAELRGGSGSEDVAAADPLCLVPTSGSTGHLKLVAMRHDTQMFRSFADRLIIEESHLGTFALDGITGQNCVFLRYGSWTQMSAAALTARPTSVLDAIEQHRITWVSATNSMVKQIIAAAEQTSRRWNFSALRRIAIGGETIVPKVMERLGRFLEEGGASRDIVRVGYGTSETGTLVTGANPFAGRLAGADALALGTCSPGVSLRIVTEGNEILTEGDIGAVQVRCPQKIFSCYWGEPEASRDCFTDDGWWRTGDLGRLQNEQLSLHGRAKDVLVVAGKKFSLSEIEAEIETVLAAGDRVFSCAIHDAEEGAERLAIVVVAAHGNEHHARLAEDIRAVVARRFGIRPDRVVPASIDQIPLGANGKVRRTELAGRIRQGLIAAAVQVPQTPSQSEDAHSQQGADSAQILAAIWRETLDLHGEIDKGKNFFDLGGNSLRSLMLYTAIEAQFGCRISAEAFFRSPTFADLLSLVSNKSPVPALDASSSNSAIPWPLPGEVRNKLILQFHAWGGSRPTRDGLTAGLNLAGRKTPLFWVCQEGSEFRRLAGALGPEQPLYAFRSGMRLIHYNEDEVQAFALRYVAEIEEAYPEGPVFIGGNCQGAIIALSMAHHLLRRKRHVPLLILVEWGFPLQPYPGPVLLIHHADSIDGNPYLRYQNPDVGLARAFPHYRIEEIPGDHPDTFNDSIIVVLAEILKSHMSRAEREPPRFIPKSAYRAAISVDGIPDAIAAGSSLNIGVTIRNVGDVTWPATEHSGLMLGNRWLDDAGEVITLVDGRAPLPQLAPGEEASVSLRIVAPCRPGTAQLVLDAVEEGSTWFHSAQDAPLRASVRIVEPAANR